MSINRYLRYETNASNNNDTSYGEVVHTISDSLINVNMSGTGVILEHVRVSRDYIPKIGDWVTIEWKNGNPIANGGGGTSSGTRNINENIKVVSTNDISSGTINSDHIRVDTIESRHITAHSIKANHIDADQINADHISANQIISEHISANQIVADKINTDAILSRHIKSGEIVAEHISANSIESKHISANSINSVHLSSNSIESHHISSNSITAEHISANSIESRHIVAGDINSQHISSNSIEGKHISAGSIESQHISANSIQSNHISSNTINSIHILSDSIKSEHILANSIESKHISSESIESTHISAYSIKSEHISSNSIISDHISSNSIQSVHIGVRTIQSSHISSNSIQGEHISSNSILSNHIVSNSINGEHISAGSIESEHISSNTIEGQHIIAGTIESIHISSNSIESKHVKADAINATHISSNSIESQHISANSIESGHIVSESIDSNKLSVGARKQGLIGQYFTYDSSIGSNKFQVYKGTRIDETINFDWTTGSPALVGQADNFSVRWQGFMLAPETGQYEFHGIADDTIKVVVDNETIINQTTYQNGVEQTGLISLEKDKWYQITVEMTEVTSSALVELRWTKPSLVKEIIPAKYFTQANTVIEGSTITTSSIVASHIKTGTITAESGIIADLAIQTAHIDDGVITSAKIGQAEVESIHIASGNIQNIHIENATIDYTKIKSVDAETISVGKLIGEQISAGVITGGHISGNTITGDLIKSSEIDTTHLKAGSITATKIATGTIEAKHIGSEQITSDKVMAGSIETYHISTIGLDAETVTVYSSETGETLVGGGYLRVGGLDAGVVQSDNLANNGLFLVSSDDWGLARNNTEGETILGMQNDAPGGSTIWKYNMTTNPPTLINDNIIAGKKPSSIIIDSMGQYAYVSNQGDNTISKIDLINNTEIDKVDVGQEPFVLKFTPNEEYILVPNSDLGNKKEPDSISIVDVSSFSLHKRITVGSSPFDIVTNSTGTLAYVSCSYPNDIYIVDLVDFRVIGAIPLGLGTFPAGIAISSDDTTLYTCNSVGDSVSVVDLYTGQTTAQIEVDDAPVMPVIFNNMLYVSCGGANNVNVIDMSTNQVVSKIDVGVKPTVMTVNPYAGTGGYLFVSCGGTNSIVTIDISYSMAIGYVETGANPIGIALYPNYEDMFIVNNGDSAILSFTYPSGGFIGDAYVSSDGTATYAGADGWIPNRSDWVYDGSGNVIGASTSEFHLGEPLHNEGGYAKLTAMGAVNQFAYIEQDIHSVTNFSDGNNIASRSEERLRPKDYLSTSGNTDFYPSNDWLISPSPAIYVSESGGTAQLIASSDYTIEVEPSKVIFNDAIPSGNNIYADYDYRESVWFSDHTASVKTFSEQPVSPNYSLSFEVDELVPKFVTVNEMQTSPFTPTDDGVNQTYDGLILSSMTNQAFNTTSGNILSNGVFDYGSSSTSDISRVVNGNTSSNDYYSNTSGESYVQIDLGGTYMIDEVKVWHYYDDGRTYSGNITEVSPDGTNWQSIWDYRVHGVYQETLDGHSIQIPASPVRFIRDTINGSSANASNHWVEIKAFGDWKLEAGEMVATPYGTFPKYSFAMQSKNSNVNETLITTDVSNAFVEYNIDIEFTSDWYINYVTGSEFGVAKVFLDDINLLRADGKTNFHIYQNANLSEYMYYQGIKLKPGIHKVRIEQTTGKVNFDRLRFDDFQKYSKSYLSLNNTNTTWHRDRIVPKDAQFYVGQGMQSTTGPYDRVRINTSTGQPDGSVPLKYRVRTMGELVGDGTNQRGISYVTGFLFEKGKQFTHWRRSQISEKIPTEMVESWDDHKPHTTGIQTDHLANGAVHSSKILSNSIMDHHISPYARIGEFKLDLDYPTHGHNNKAVIDSIEGFSVSGGNNGTGNTIAREDHKHDYVPLSGGVVDGDLTVNGLLNMGSSTSSATQMTFDGETSSSLRIQNDNGYVSITPLNSGWAHIYSDRSDFIFNKPVYTTANIFSSYNNDMLLRRSGITKLTLGGTSATFVDEVIAPTFSKLDGTEVSYDGHIHFNATSALDGFMPKGDKDKIDTVQYSANNYLHPDTHSISMITETTSGKIMTSEERTKLSEIETSSNNYSHPASHSLSMITETTDKKVMTSSERTKLSGIETSANNYSHPSSHSLSMITETTDKKIMTSGERTKLASVESSANNYSHPTGAGSIHVPSGGAIGNFLEWSSNGVATWSNINWSDVNNKPTTFTPSSHGHTASEIADLYNNVYSKTEVNTLVEDAGDIRAGQVNTFTETNTFTKGGIGVKIQPSGNVIDSTKLFTVNRQSGNAIFSVKHGNVVTIDGDLQVTGETQYTGTTNVDGDYNVGGNITVSGNSTLGDSLTDLTTVNGDLEVKGELIERGKYEEVHRRPLFGIAGDLQFQTDSTVFEQIVDNYSLTSYANPSVPLGATRYYRLYVIYGSDSGNTANQDTTLRLSGDTTKDFTLPSVTGSANGRRDWISGYFNDIPTGAINIQAKLSLAGSNLGIRWIELIAYDVY